MRAWLCAVVAAALVSTVAPETARAEAQPDLRTLRANVRRLLRDTSTGTSAPARTTATTSSDTPQNITVGGAVGRAHVSWLPPAGAVTGYRVYSGPTSGSLVGIGTTTGTGFTARGLTVGRTYWYAVAATTSAGEGPRSAPVSVTIPSREIVFSIDGALAAQSRRDAPVVPILDDAYDHNEPAVSPDGKRVAFVSNATGLHGIHVRDSDGTGPFAAVAAETPGPGAHEYFQPSWSPDGKYLVATQTAVDDPSYVGAVVLSLEHGVWEEYPELSSPSWTPGASFVAVDEATGRLVEHTLHLAGGRRGITGATQVLDAEVSPDGGTVAFTQVTGTFGGFPLTTVRLVPRYGGTAKTIAAPGGVNSDVTWAPDGRRVYFTHRTTSGSDVGAPRVVTVAADGTGYDQAALVGSTAPSSRHAVTRPRAVASRAPLHNSDFNGDGFYDIGVYRPSNGTWYVRGMFTVQWGAAGDVPAPADYDGDRRTDITVFRPSNGGWYRRGHPAVSFGRTGDIPVPADYNGDGRDEIAVYRPSTSTWYVRGQQPVVFGKPGDVPLPGGYGTRPQWMAVWRPSNGTWYIREKPGYAWVTRAVQFGQRGDIPMLLDQHVTDPEYSHLGLLRPSTGEVFEKSLQSRGFLRRETFGLPMQTYGSVPLGMVWRKPDMAGAAASGGFGLFQSATGLWSNVTQFGPIQWGRQGDLPL